VADITIGPHNPRFHPDVGHFLNGNPPTAVEKSCLRRFFEELRSGPVTIPGEKFANGEFKYAWVCEHVVTFYDYGNFVKRISPKI